MTEYAKMLYKGTIEHRQMKSAQNARDEQYLRSQGWVDFKDLGLSKQSSDVECIDLQKKWGDVSALNARIAELSVVLHEVKLLKPSGNGKYALFINDNQITNDGSFDDVMNVLKGQDIQLSQVDGGLVLTNTGGQNMRVRLVAQGKSAVIKSDTKSVRVEGRETSFTLANESPAT